MSACGSLQHIFETPSLPENPSLIESLSWNQIKHPVKSIHHSSSFTEIFGELHFEESPQPSPSPSPSPSSFSEINHTNIIQNELAVSHDIINQTPSSSAYVSNTPTTAATTTTTTTYPKSHKSSDSFSSLSSESLYLCTEGLGFESCDDVEDLKINGVSNEGWQSEREKEGIGFHGECSKTRSRVNGVEYPPPISCIGRSGKPWVSFMSYRKNGRFVLQEIRIPKHEFLHAHREDGRLKLHFVHPHDEEFLEEKEDDHDDENHEDEDEEEDYDDVESIVKEGEENDESVTNQVTEEKTTLMPN